MASNSSTGGVKSAAEDVKADVSQLRDDAGRVVQKVKEVGRAGVESAREKLNEGVESARQYAGQARHYAEDYAQLARERGTQAVHTVEDSIKANPVAALAIAAGVGVVVGLWLRRSHH